ncbi:kinesin-like protein KIF19 isoform X1 [Hydra vulgaris]|uniref:kinesin-like protein KIF19 isoform X1 n=1 Tax=Hydra vulgaris TaxID=6087 RepID=UPI0006410153|nr:kinesin-like protein KIF19 isoform X1 [Hydra vulgaris]
MEELESNIKVAVRVRPASIFEITNGYKTITTVLEDNMVCLEDPTDNDDQIHGNRSRAKSYVFDHAFGPSSTQVEVYNHTAKPLIESVLKGYNATIFAYGPTGTGKTYTMLGTDYSPGIMVLTLNDLYKQIDHTRHDKKYKVKLSYLELYNEMIRDLLKPSSEYLDLRENSKGVQVAGLTEYEVLSTSQVMEMLSRGNRQRMCEPTAVNTTSSRSHAVLQVTVEQQNRIHDIKNEVKVGKLFMIDLAGSERAADTQNTGKRLIEGAHINRSLLALGNCINALSEKGKGAYINYRDSKLTRLLKDSLDGNCKTVMITHVSPADRNFEETRNTLSYADRAKSIKIKPKVNQYNVNYHVAQYQSIINELKDELVRLKGQMHLKSNQKSAGETRSKSAEIKEKLKEELKLCFEEQLELRKEIIDLEMSCVQYLLEYQRKLLIIDEWEHNKARNLALERRANESIRGGLKNHVNAFHAKVFNQFQQDIREPADVAIAREELQKNQIIQYELSLQKKKLIEKLDEQKNELAFLEESCHKKITNEEHKEVLNMLCKLHEYEIKNIELESIKLMREYSLEQKDLKKQRDEMRQNMAHEIIELQKNIIKKNNIQYPLNLDALYEIYKEEISKDRDMDIFMEVQRLGRQSNEFRLPSLNPSSSKAIISAQEGYKSKMIENRWLEQQSSNLKINNSDALRRKDNRVSVTSITSDNSSVTYRVPNKKLYSLSEASSTISNNDLTASLTQKNLINTVHENNARLGIYNQQLRETNLGKKYENDDLKFTKNGAIDFDGKEDFSIKSTKANWKNNFNKKLERETVMLESTENGRSYGLSNKERNTEFKYTKNNQINSPTLINSRFNKTVYTPLKPNVYPSVKDSNGNLSVSGTSFAPKPTLPGFGRI